MTQTRTWVLATQNAGKLAELTVLLASADVDLRPVSDFGLREPIEDGETFEANAEIKAVAAMQASELPALSDDSGVEVDALGGEPGIHTALWAGPNRDFAKARQRVHERLLKLGLDGSRATYVSVLCLAIPGQAPVTFRGETRGSLVWPIRGDLGSGFEPMFMPDGYAITYGEMPSEQRILVNARAQAMRRLLTSATGGTSYRNTGTRI